MQKDLNANPLSFNEEELEVVFRELEQMDQDWATEGVPAEYSMIWVPNNEVRLWSIPRPTGQLLKTLVLLQKPQNIVEVGTSAGYSTLWLASGAATYGGHIKTIEATQPKINMAKKSFDRTGLQPVIEQLHGLAGDVLESWQDPIDFIFLDADKQNYFQYLKQFEPHLHAGSIIVADNVIDFGDLMPDFLDYLQKSPDYHSQVIQIDHGVLTAVKLK